MEEKIELKKNLQQTNMTKSELSEEEKRDLSRARVDKLYRRYIGSWDSVQEVADKNWKDVCTDTLYKGEVIFSYKTSDNELESENNPLYQVIISKDIEEGDYIVNIVTLEWSSLLNHLPLTYLQNELMDRLVEWKIDKETLITLKQRLEDEE